MGLKWERVRTGSAGSHGGLSLCPPCSAPPLWAVSQSKATAGPQLDPVPPDKWLPAALGLLKAFLLFSLFPSSPSPPSPCPMFPPPFPSPSPPAAPPPPPPPPLPSPPPPPHRPKPRGGFVLRHRRGSPRAVTSWGGETPRRDVTAGWYSTCVAVGGGGTATVPGHPPASPAECPAATLHPTAPRHCKPLQEMPYSSPCTLSIPSPRGSPALQHPAPLPQYPLHPFSTPISSVAPLLHPQPLPHPAQILSGTLSSPAQSDVHPWCCIPKLTGPSAAPGTPCCCHPLHPPCSFPIPVPLAHCPKAGVSLARLGHLCVSVPETHTDWHICHHGVMSVASLAHPSVYP